MPSYRCAPPARPAPALPRGIADGMTDARTQVTTADAHRHPRAAAARSAHLRHGPLQLPLSVLHAEGGLRARLRVHGARGVADARGDREGGPGLCGPGRDEAAPDGRRAAAAAKPRAP